MLRPSRDVAAEVWFRAPDLVDQPGASQEQRQRVFQIVRVVVALPAVRVLRGGELRWTYAGRTDPPK
jgi:hypothetical protein